MTIEDLLVEVFEALGEPGDLEIYDTGTTTVNIALAGSVRILKWINRAYKRIVNWKFPNGTQARFPLENSELYFKTVVKSGTAASATSTTVTLDTGVEAEADRYNGWLIHITGGTGAGQKRLIVDFSAARVADVSHAWATNPDATSLYSLYKRRYFYRESTATDVSENIPLSPITQVATALKLSCPEDAEDIERGGRTETFMTDVLENGDPDGWIELGDSILFDINIDSERWYRLEYSKIPGDLTALTERPRVPESFHEPLALYAQWIGLRRSQEWGGAYSTKRDIEDLMSTLKTSLEMAFERDDIGALY